MGYRFTTPYPGTHSLGRTNGGLSRPTTSSSLRHFAGPNSVPIVPSTTDESPSLQDGPNTADRLTSRMFAQAVEQDVRMPGDYSYGLDGSNFGTWGCGIM